MLNRIFLVILLTGIAGVESKDSVIFENRYSSFLHRFVTTEGVLYGEIKKSPEQLDFLISILAKADTSILETTEQKIAFWLNGYNLLVLKSVVNNYPLQTIRNIPGFFETIDHRVGGQLFTLNAIEKKIFRLGGGDPRMHFALVCAARSCPIFPVGPFSGRTLDRRLEKQVLRVVNDKQFVSISTDEKKLKLSSIFKWYLDDFEREAGSILNFLQRYRSIPDDTDLEIIYMDYNWNLNDASSNIRQFQSERNGSLREWTPSRLLRRGEKELKIFSNLYTQTAFYNSSGEKRELGERSTYFTGITEFLYGVNAELSIGLEMYIKSVKLGKRSSSPFNVFGFSNHRTRARTAVALLGPQIKTQPFKYFQISGALREVALETSLLFPLVNNLESGQGVFLEYDAVQWWNRFLYDRSLSPHFFLYAEWAAFWRFGRTENAFSSPLKLILNYYPGQRQTLYLAWELAPSWSGISWTSYYMQIGIGGKLQINRFLELEVLGSRFPSGKNSGAGITYNLGLRILM